MTSSVIHLHIGGAGVMIGDALWKLYEKEESDTNVKSYIYNENENNNYPLALFVDSDEQMINKVKKNQSIKYKSTSFVSGKEDASNNFCRAFNAVGKQLIEQSLDQLRKQIESIDRLDQFIITSALSGGTGSGFAALLLERISKEYGRKTQKNAFLVYPSQEMSNNIVDLYNVIYSIDLTLEDCHSVVMLDNQSMYESIDSQFGLDFVDYTLLNNLISQLISSYTGLRRFSQIDNKKLLSGLCSYDRIHYITPSYGPLATINDQIKYELNEKQLISYITKPEQRLFQNKIKPYHLSAALVHRSKGENQFFGQSDQAFQKMKIRYQESPYVLQCISQNYTVIPELAQLKQTGVFLSNDLSMLNYLEIILKKFYKVFDKRAFLHWFTGEGGGFGWVQECMSKFEYLIADYKEVQIKDNDID
ncbi:unnamed protein product (macronuclear) [Paramecium tetraurelia]|uniref:Chromosome undetermined scaffold_52, whole genome shotgun sequence n=1 Tax=Paramecium tetraurelia TaxID=5888 RepID=Q3SEH0_PARTE|nr:uncharacterized protein GSPATT00017219001 [Paramecium tetraurelia]CAI38954.1 putative alpha tubulin [Paramecium tetraurelia]CAK82862.1 unnamed protein product [Paramecium tetraurelia]|eukprot:XP_001450259.1 hypothetical protein (macronuclear) [Paramecium tetraurelia strain d4-2]